MQNIFLAISYVVAAKLCQLVAIEPGNVTPIWITSGICFLWVNEKGYKVLPGVFIGAFCGNVSAYIYPVVAAKLPAAITSGVINGLGDVLCTYIGVYTLKRVAKGAPVLSSLQSAATFIFFGVFVGASVSAAFGVTGLATTGMISWSSYELTFTTWLNGDAMGILIVVPFVENFFILKNYRQINKSKRHITETVLLFIVMAFLVSFGLKVHYVSPVGINIPVYLIMPLLAMMAFRFEEPIMVAISFIYSTYALLMIVGRNQANTLELLIFAQMLIFAIGSTLLLIVAAINKINFLNKQMIQTDRLITLGELSAGMAHEINNPLHIISNTAAIIKRHRENPEKIKASVKIINTGVERIEKIVNGLKNFSRGTDDSSKIHTYLKDLCQDCLMLTELRAKKENIQLMLPNLGDQQIMADRIQLSQVFVNLINNAIDENIGNENAWIEIEVSEDDMNYIILIKDSGRGIDEARIDKLFNPFYTTKEIGKGTGLGLSISKGIVQDHGGDLQYKLVDGHTAFEITLPKQS